MPPSHVSRTTAPAAPTTQSPAYRRPTQLPAKAALVRQAGATQTVRQTGGAQAVAATSGRKPTQSPGRVAAVTPATARAATQPAARAAGSAAASAGPALVTLLPGAMRPAVVELAGRLHQQSFYHLLTLALGYDPLSGKQQVRSGGAVADALLPLLPGGKARYEQVRAAGAALARLPDWLAGQLALHHLSGARLRGVLAGTRTQLEKGTSSFGGFLKMVWNADDLVEPWLKLGTDVVGLVAGLELELLLFVARAVLGEQADPLFKALAEAGELLPRILRNPMPFVRTLIAAAQQGFNLFVDKAPMHLKKAVEEWLFGPLAAEGIPVPKVWTARAMLDLLLHVLGLTKQHVLERLRERVTATVGPEAAQRLEQFGEAAVTLLSKGPLALWHDITEQAGNLLTQAFDAVQGQIMAMLAKGVAKLVAKLVVPGGALVQALQTTYDVYQTVVTQAQAIVRVGLALFGMVRSVEQGQTKPAAEAMEGILARLLRVALDFLARTFSLDQLPRLLRAGLAALRKPVDKGIDWVINGILKIAKAAWQGLKAGGRAVGQAGQRAVGAVKGWLGLREEFTLPGTQEHHSVFLDEDTGQLMLASVPHPYEKFLLQDPAAKKHKARLTPLVDQVVSLSEARNKLHALPPASTARARELHDLRLRTNEARLKKVLKQLAELTMDILVDGQRTSANPAARNNTSPTYAVLSNGGFGGGAIVRFWSTMTMSMGTPTNIPWPSTPTHSSARYAQLYQRRSKGATNFAYYVQGHLINAELHGPGDDWRNLTPLSSKGNSHHRAQAETYLTTVVKDARAARTAGNSLVDRAFLYSVVPTYGRPVREDLIKQLATSSRFSLAAERQAVEAIIRAERYVPRNLVCTVREVDPSTSAPMSDAPSREKGSTNLSFSWVVNNVIEQDSLDNYSLDKKQAVAAQGPKTLDINHITSASELRQPELLVLTKKVAAELVAQLSGPARKRFASPQELLNFLNDPALGQTPAEQHSNVEAAEEAIARKLLIFG